MLTIETSPNVFVPNAIGESATWVVYNPDLRVVVGQPNTYILRFTSSGSNAETFTLAGVNFTTDDSTSYSSTTFDHSVSNFRSAMNCANMLRSNAAFRNYSIKTARPSNGQPWRVIAVAEERYNATVDENNNDLSGLTGVTLEQVAGLAEQRLNQRLFYQFYDESGPVSPEYYAPFDKTGRSVIDGNEVARRFLNATAPDPRQTDPFLDTLAVQYLSVKFGTYQTDNNCSPSFGEVLQSPSAPFINAIRQVEHVNGLNDFSPFRASPIRWLSIKPNSRKVDPSGYDWAAIYLGPNPWYSGAQNWRLSREFFDDQDNSLSVVTNDLNGAGLWRVPTGFANGVPDGIGDVARFTVKVEEPFGFGWTDRSETLNVQRVRSRSCNAQIFYLAALGGWEVMSFDELIGRELLSEGETWQEPLFVDPGFKGDVLAKDGGIYQRVTSSAQRFTLTTTRITDNDRESVEELLETPQAYLLTEDENGRKVTRRVLFTRGGYQTYTSQGRSVVSLTFSFAQPRRLR